MTTSRVRGKAARHFDIALWGVLYSVHVGVQAGVYMEGRTGGVPRRTQNVRLEGAAPSSGVSTII